MKYGKQGHYIRNCGSQNITPLKNIKKFKSTGEKKKLRRTQEYKIRHFAFCYNNNCLVYKETKYGINYQPQELSLKQFKGIKEENEQDRLWYGTDIYGNDLIKNL